MTLWKISCNEDQYPGLWRHWYRSQCVGLGWYSKWGFTLAGHAKTRGWARARAALKRIKAGDHIVVSLHQRRVGRLGEVVRLAVGDGEENWNPLVPRSQSLPDGELGRRIEVRWDLSIGPDNRDEVVLLPEDCSLTQPELRPTLAEIRSLSLADLRRAMADERNWIRLLPAFNTEKALSDYIAAYPHHLQDGLVPHPSRKVRELVFDDGSRLDVLLLDNRGMPVIVECKQHAPTLDNLKQIRRYMAHLEKETHIKPRGILVHGGSRKIDLALSTEAGRQPVVELVHHSLRVEFRPSS